MRNAAAVRAENTRESLDKMLAARRLREEGLKGAAFVPVMRDAGLTHGAFSSHFSSKDDLAAAAFGHATTTGRAHWIKPSRGEPWKLRLTGLAKQYLASAHCDNLSTSCGFATLSSDAAHASPSFRARYEHELGKSLAAICEGDDDRLDDAIALMTIASAGCRWRGRLSTPIVGANPVAGPRRRGQSRRHPTGIGGERHGGSQALRASAVPGDKRQADGLRRRGSG
jgi:TetR/AcrR family transcriptional regulator, transcriptional repressor for nem operon